MTQESTGEKSSKRFSLNHNQAAYGDVPNLKNNMPNQVLVSGLPSGEQFSREDSRVYSSNTLSVVEIRYVSGDIKV